MAPKTGSLSVLSVLSVEFVNLESFLERRSGMMVMVLAMNPVIPMAIRRTPSVHLNNNFFRHLCYEARKLFFTIISSSK